VVSGFKADDYSEQKRVLPYLQHVDDGQRIELYPAPRGIERNAFVYVDSNGTHIKIRNDATGTEYYVPFEMIEFISPGPKHSAVIRLRRAMEARGSHLL
jgi:hypothetical protein